VNLATGTRIECCSVVGRHPSVEGGEVIARLGDRVSVYLGEIATHIERRAGEGEGGDQAVFGPRLGSNALTLPSARMWATMLRPTPPT
jgi:hypothetical protein